MASPISLDNSVASGEELIDLIGHLFPLHRAQTGAGNRETFKEIGHLIPLSIHETPSGTAAFDWTIPQEWTIRDASIKQDGETIVNYNESNLHVFNGSCPIETRMSTEHLLRHVCVGSRPGEIPYRTVFFRDEWGFCITPEQELEIQNRGGEFDILIDSDFRKGSLTHAECHIQGQTDETFLIWAHCCHPSLANDNLSGISVATYLAKYLLETEPYYSYRVVFAPATIGAINWLANYRGDLTIVGGLVLSLLGDEQHFHYKKSRQENTTIDRLFESLFSGNTESGQRFNGKVIDFDPFGYDERQFCAPSIDFPVGRLTRSLPGEFPEYHTSFDNQDLVDAQHLAGSLQLLIQAINRFDQNRKYRVTGNGAEPFLQPFDLYSAYGSSRTELSQAVMWLLSLSDGRHDLIDIHQRSCIEFDVLVEAAKALLQYQIIEELT